MLLVFSNGLTHPQEQETHSIRLTPLQLITVTMSTSQEDLPMAEGSMRGNHDGASFIPIEDHPGAELSPLLAYGQTAQSTNDEWLGIGRKGIKLIRGIIGSR
jgi:hypothetical protein